MCDQGGVLLQGDTGDLQVQIDDRFPGLLELRLDLSKAVGRPLVVWQDGQRGQQHIQPGQVFCSALRFGCPVHQLPNAGGSDRQLFIGG